MDRETVERLAAGSGFSQDPLEKVIRLAGLADAISRHPLLSEILALKGGTALNMFGGLPPRLSVDLDFNCVGALDRQAMLKERPEVERAVDRIAREQKYEIQWSREEHAGPASCGWISYSRLTRRCANVCRSGPRFSGRR
jgi:hypothetical protein